MKEVGRTEIEVNEHLKNNSVRTLPEYSFKPFIIIIIIIILCYESEGRWFDSRWCHWNFSLA
jgi:hypothetical protein